MRGLVHGKFQLQHELVPYSIAADKINTLWQASTLSQSHPRKWTRNDFSNAARAPWEPGTFLPNSDLKKLVKDLAEEFTADPDLAETLIFAADEFQKSSSTLIEYVITAVAKAPAMGIKPFVDLAQKGMLPGRQKIFDIFLDQLSQEQIETCFELPFIPGKLASFHSTALKKIFYRLGISNADSIQCAKSLAPPSPIIKGLRKNPGEQKCADHFILAILQDDIRNRKIKVSDVLDRFKKYGITKSRYYQLKHGKFNPNCIKDTPGNRQQISRMARALSHDPIPLLDVLIEK